MKKTRIKTYLTIPVFLGMLLVTGRVAADEVEAAAKLESSSSATVSAVPTTVTAETNPVPPQGTYTFTETTGVKAEPIQASPDLDFYQPGEQAHYDKTVENDDRLWISYNSNSGKRSYVAVRDLPDNPKTAPVSSPAATDPETLPDQGSYKFTEKTPVKAEPKLSSPDRAFYDAGETVNYDKKLEADDHLWLSYTNYSGTRSYVPVAPVAASAKVEVVDYKEDKTDFTVKVTGTKPTKPVSHVRVAVWSDSKGQDDIKWYEPAVRNNQASAKVDIANHSNTTDDYHVHVYTTFKDATTVGTNLGTYRIEKPVAQPASATSLSGSGTYTFAERLPVKREPKISSPDRAYYEAGEKVHYDRKLEADNHLWISYINYSGGRSYIPVSKLATPARPATPAAPTDPAKIEVVDYKEDKTNFTVKVTGSAETKPVSHVRVAVWSDAKGQDDIKWYEPGVSNNQASAKVDIANHSNTSDNYHVHVYTTYKDGSTVGSNLGAYKITKPGDKPAPTDPAKIEVVDYKEDKTNFTVKVTGSAETKPVSHVRVAVWSDAKGQDDIKWYEPGVSNNQASAKVDIANHSNTSDNYHVHVYTTYKDGSTVGSNLGAYKITKPGDKPAPTDPAKIEVVDYKEDKTNFTVKVTGSAETKPVSHVRVAVWSDAKGQDDIKWYEPGVSNNQASAKVDIANHSNTSDNYHVHVYTTYKDGSTVGSNLGAYKITKPGDKPAPTDPAKIEVVDYKEDKTNFTVKVTGSAETKPVSHVRVAVWSDAKGQDDIKWYEPGVSNNQASAKVDIANHSNTSDNYHVHVYTTYKDGSTIGSNLGTYAITKPGDKPAPTDPAKIEVVDYKEDKTNFTVKVTGSAETKPVSHVRVAVWSDAKGQDDIKWYEPGVSNNQASAKVDIANHSNTSDNYHVHVYTTYKDGSTVGTNLGAFKVVKADDLPKTDGKKEDGTSKPADKNGLAKIEVLDYKENKNDFTVKVTGQEDGKELSHVRVAVWSEERGQDDIKWYEPKIENNEATAKVSIRQHANKSGDYAVHVYTTYKDNTTVGDNLGSYKIVRQDLKNATAEVIETTNNKMGFTVKVGGDADTQDIKQVRIAVWSDNDGNKDLRWYEPQVVNNGARQDIVLANHELAFGGYQVHVYTTYADGLTIGKAVDAVTIAKPTLADIYGTPVVNHVAESIKSVLQLAGDMLGVRTGDPAHKQLVDDYNAVHPRPVGYKVTYEDDWCDVFTTVIFQRAGLSHLIGRECGVERHIGLFQNLGIWNEDGTTTPKTGDIITFNWDQKHQANDGFADHIGIVTHVENGKIHTIEGNGDKQVRRRSYNIGDGNIRGFATPRYI